MNSLRKTISRPFPIKIARSKNEITIYSPTPIQVNKKQLQKTLNTKKISRTADFFKLVTPRKDSQDIQEQVNKIQVKTKRHRNRPSL